MIRDPLLPRRPRRAVLALLSLLAPLVAAAPAAAQPGVPPPPPPYEPIGPEITVAADGGAPALAVFAGGGWVAAWRDPDGVTLWARLYDDDDQPLGAAFVAGPAAAAPGGPLAGSSALPAVAALDDERWAVAWIETSCDECGGDLMISLYDGATPVAERLLVSGDAQHFRHQPLLASNGIDRLAVAWTEINGGPNALPDPDDFSNAYARLFDFDADPVGGVFQVNEDAFEEQTVHGAAFLAGGDLVFVWESYEGEGFFYDVYRRLFDDAGQPLEGEVRVNGDEGRFVSQLEPAVAAHGDGFVVTWTDWYPAPIAHPEAAFNGTIVATFFSRDGTPIFHDFDVSGTDPPGDRRASAVAGRGEYLAVLWEHGCAFDTCDSHPDSPDRSRVGIFADSFGPRETFNVRQDLQVHRQANGDQVAPAVAAAPNGFVAAWASRRLAGTANGPGPTRVVARRFGEPFCEELCLGFERFEVEVTWKDFQGNVGRGVPVARDDGWGTFWFFRPDNVELAVKVLDGRAINGYWWLFYASLTNVEYTLTLTDHFQLPGLLEKSYDNPSGHFGSRGDTTALPKVAVATPSIAGEVMVVPVPAEVFSALPLAPAAPPAPAAAATTLAACEAGEVCVAGDRFEIEVEWEDFFANSGAAVGMPLTADTAWFWFFRSGNPEMLVKVLDGRPVNGHWWVFYAALTNVGFTLRVTDRLTDETVTYDNPIGTFASRGDTTAFDG